MRTELSPVLVILLLSSAPAFGGQDVATKLLTIESPEGAESMAFNADGSQLALRPFGLDGTAVYDLKRRQIAHHLPVFNVGAPDRGELVQYSPNGKLLAICGFSKQKPFGFMGIYATDTWEVVHEIIVDSKEGERGCTGTAFTSDGRKLIRLARVEFDKPGSNVLVYDTSTWQVTSRFRTMAVNSNPPSPAPQMLEKYVVTPETILVDQSDPRIAFFDSRPNNVYAVSPDSRYLALSGPAWGAGKQVTVIIDIEDHKLARVIDAGSDSLDWSPDGVHLASAGGSIRDSISIFDVRTGEKVAAEPHEDGWGLVRYTPDGRYLIVRMGKRVEIWDGQHHQLLQTIHAEPRNIAVSPDSRYFALCGDKLNMLDATPLLSLFAHPNGVPGKTIVYRLK